MSIRGLLCVTVGLLALLLPSLYAQGFQATITGTVTDQQGAVVPNAKIDVKNVETNAIATSVTNDAGSYVVPFVLAGRYSVTVSSQGFKSAVRDGIDVHVADRLRLDFMLELGEVSQEVTVSGEAELLDTVSASRGQVVNLTNVRDLPLPGRNIFLLGALTTGVYDGTARPTFTGRPMDGAAGFLSINGGGGSNYEILLDGAPDVSLERSPTPYNNLVPSPEAVEEFKVQTNVYDAQYGRSAGGFLNLVLKSGTNRFHGSLYELWRNDKLNANRFEDNRSGLPKDMYRFNQPGVEFDGPVYLPKIYDGRNRTFFMYSWEAMRSGTPLSDLETLPSLAQRAGDFSKTVLANGQPITMYDPLTTQRSGSGYTREPFPGNIIPPARIDPVGAKLTTFIPNPNRPGTTDGYYNYAYGPNADKEAYDQHIIRIDQILSDHHKLFVSYTRNINHEYLPLMGWPAVASSNYTHWRGNQGAHVDVSNAFSPTLVLDTRISFMRHVFAIQFRGDPYNPADLGFPASLVSQLPRLTFPYIGFSEYSSFGACCFAGTGSSTRTYTYNYSMASALSKIVRTHALRMGGEVRVLRSSQMLPASSSGAFNFDAAFTRRDPLNADVSSGNEFASFLLGYPGSGVVPWNIQPAYQDRYYALFLQDDWRVTSKLSLNLGLRWSYESGMTERFNQQNRGFDPNADNPFQVPGLKLKGGLLFTDSNHRLAYNQDLKDFQPRIGVAYRVRPKLVFRGGYGITYAPFMYNGYNNGFSIQTPFVSSVDGGLTPANRLSNPFPAGILRPVGSSQGLATLVGNSFTYGYYDLVIPRTHQFSAGFQHELPWRMVVDVSYVGQRMHNLLTSKNINAVSAANLALGTQLLTPVPNPFQGLLPGTALNGPTVPRQQLLLPFPQFGNITEANRAIGSVWYNSLQVRLEKRLSAGLQFQLSSTISKVLQATSYLNAQDPIGALARVIAGDPPQIWVLATNYALPFFKDSRGVVKQVLSGWQANFVFRFQSGRTIGAPGGAYSTGINPALPASPQSWSEWFNTCTLSVAGVRQHCHSAQEPVAWLIQPSFTLRTLSTVLPNIRTAFRKAGDLGLSKTFPLREPLRLQFRAEAFNFTNTPEFGAPNTNVNSSNFGVVTPAQINDPRFVQLMLKLTF